MTKRRVLIQLSGIPGTGKSTLARGLADHMVDTRAINKDDDTRFVRAHLPDLSGSALSEAVYRRTFKRVQLALSSGQSVVVDSPAYRNTVAQSAAALAYRYDAELFLVELSCGDRRVLQERLDTRPERNYRANDDLFELSVLPIECVPALIETAGRSISEALEAALHILDDSRDATFDPPVMVFTASGLIGGGGVLAPAMANRLASLRGARTRLGLIDDVAGEWLGDAARYFDAVVDVNESGRVLPDPRLTKQVLSRLGFAGRLATVTFVDQSVANVEAAQALGLKSVSVAEALETNDADRSIAVDLGGLQRPLGNGQAG